MRLHRLEITAFGPFSGTETVDFDALSDAGLFLVHGQTGAGKTSVLDAVCFALYGRVPGVRGKADGLRSDHAAPGAAPQVVLETTLRGRRFRFTRSPAWERPKLRGAGTVREQSRVLVEEFSRGAWNGLTNRIDEAADLVQRLLGMNADQFCQVVLLPQGEFAAFLRAGAEERRAVLERLFAAEIYARVEKWLVDTRVQTGQEADGLRRRVENVADRIAEVTGAHRPDAALLPRPRRGEPGDEPAGPLESLVPWAAELSGHLADMRAVAEELSAHCERRLERAREALEQGRMLAERRHRHAEALRRRAALAEHAAERAGWAARLEDAARADRVVPLIRAAADRERRAEQARRRAAEARAAVGALVPAIAPDDVLHKAEQDLRRDAARLDGLRGEAARERGLTEQAAALAADIDRLQAEQTVLSDRVRDLPAQVERYRAELDEMRVRVAGRPAAKAAVDAALHRVETAERRDAVTAELARAEERDRMATDRAQDLRDRVQEIRQARLDGMAAELASELAPGEPCAVCGSREHPAPAAARADAPTLEQERQAQADYDRALAERQRAGNRVAELRAELDALLEVTEEPVEALAAAHAEALAELEALTAEAARLDALEHRLACAEEDLARARDQHDAVRAELTRARTRHQEIATELARLRAGLDEARGQDPTLEARIDRLTRDADRLAAAVEAARDAATAADALAEARAAAERAAADAGFDGLDRALRAALDDRARTDLQERVRRFDAEEAGVRAELEDPALLDAAARPAPDLDALQAAFETARREHNAAYSALDRARTRAGRLAELRAELTAAVEEWRPAARRHAVAARVSRLATGQHADNRERMRLSAYVLAARLEQVVAAANARLARMSAGRYELEHTTDKAAADGRRGGTGGLGLRVADAWTGRSRDPATLSGGESFITSLALALGLADVVTAESAAGTEIGTLFVDEGFGTLDADTLDEVMEVLDGLRDGGRAVGIVSHVAELRGRIPAQLRVRKERAGSTVAVTA
ncbi:AAA family ATPase [Thermomonospora amylolytica]|uniref:AAA family ATPase n=1 Tax=Thermomonospora amylolytica TaxID=1411117 RepID=UPI000E6CCBC1|nr:SMC family ATPase [Thermomonospora amylolytica]